jgi:[acyl-carrier-protein] S-malonyltransferase
MGRSLYEEYETTKMVFSEARQVLGYDLRSICFDGTLKDLSRLEYALPAIYVVSIAAYQAYKRDIGIHPQFVAGHSLGEISALTCGGFLSFQDGLRIVMERSRLAMQTARSCKAHMSIIEGLTSSEVSGLCSKASESIGGTVEIACFNTANQVAVSGNRETLHLLENLCSQSGASVTPIFTGAPFHSSLMDAARMEFKELMGTVTINKPRYPVVMNVNALPIIDKTQVVDAMTNQLIRTVQWDGTMQFMSRRVTELIEIGPSSILTDLCNQEHMHIRCTAYHRAEDRKQLKNRLAGTRTTDGAIRETGFTLSIPKGCKAIVAATRNASIDSRDYEEGVVKPYRELESINRKWDAEGLYPDHAASESALTLLGRILAAKRVPRQQRVEKIRALLSQTGVQHIFSEYVERIEKE